MASPGELLDRARDYDGLGDIIFAGIGGSILALVFSGINLMQAIFGVLINPLGAFGTELGNVVTAFVGGGAAIIEQGAVTTVSTLAPGATWAVGPLTFAFGIAAAGGGIIVMGWILARSATSDLIPFSFTDVPLLGVDEDEEEIIEED